MGLVCREEASAAAVLQYEEAQRHKHSSGRRDYKPLAITASQQVCVCLSSSLCMFYDSGDAHLISIMCLGGCSDDDDEASCGDEHFTLQSPGRPSSIDTTTAESWTQAETSDTLRRLMSGSKL